MRRVFNSWCWSLAGLFRGTALALILFGAVRAGAAVVSTTNAAIGPASAVRMGTGLLVDWNQDFIIHENLKAENVDRPALPALSPDEPQAVQAAATSDEADADDATADNEATAAENEDGGSDATDKATATANDKAPEAATDKATADAGNSIPDASSDYEKYKLGHLGGYYGENADAASPAEKPASETGTHDEATGQGTTDGAAPAADTSSSDAGKTESDSNSDTTDKSSDDMNYSRPETFTPDYMKYKYGRFGKSYGENADVHPTSPQSTDSGKKTEVAPKAEPTKAEPTNTEAAKTDDTTMPEDSSQADDSTKADDATKPDDATKADDATETEGTKTEKTATKPDESSKSETDPKGGSPEGLKAETDDATKTGDAANTDDATQTDATQSGEVPKTEKAATKPDESPKPDADPKGSSPTGSKTEASPAPGSTASLTVQDYYRYRYESLEGRYGDDRKSAGDEDATPSTNGSTSPHTSVDGMKDDSAAPQTSVDGMRMDAEDSGGQTTRRAEGSGSSSMAGAMLAVVSSWADDVASGYGLKMSQVIDLLSQMK